MPSASCNEGSAWTVVVPRMQGYVHIAALQEVVEAVLHGLRQLGQSVFLADPSDRMSRNSILIGGHLLSAERCASVPQGAIVYNSEHAGSRWLNTHYRMLLNRTTVWDYSLDNAEMLAGRLGQPVRYVPLGYVPSFARIPPRHPEDIDVLFYGSWTERRGAVFEAIRSHGIAVHHAFGVYGAERDALIARAKIVLNVHAYLPGAFESVRVCYLLANSKAVVSEVNPGERIDTDLVGALVAARYDDIATKVAELVADAPARAALGLAGLRKFSSRDQAAILRQALADRLT